MYMTNQDFDKIRPELLKMRIVRIVRGSHAESFPKSGHTFPLLQKWMMLTRYSTVAEKGHSKLELITSKVDISILDICNVVMTFPN